MVDASVDAFEFETNGRLIRAAGPIGRAVGDAHSNAFRDELRRLIGLEDGIELYERGYGNDSIYIPDSGHAYWVYSGLAQQVDIDTDLWTAHIVVTYATDDNGYYDILSEKDKVGVYRNPEFCAALALNAVKAHRAAGFTELPITQQWSEQDLRLYSALGRSF